MPDFTHLHVHTQYSLLDGAADIKRLLAKASADQMKAVAITDHGNMFGVFKFVAEAAKANIKPIIGCEFYMVADRHKKSFSKENRDRRYHQLLLAKNAVGYKNLVKLSSLGYMEGLYGKYPRIDKELLLRHHEGIIATSCCIGAEIPQAILKEGDAKADELLKWWLEVFGDDFYIELQRHSIGDQDIVNTALLKLAARHKVRIICSNDSHYVDQDDSNAHDILLCVNTGDVQRTPVATEEEGGKGYRFGFPNNQFFFKTKAEMASIFSDLPEALENTQEIVDKVELISLQKEILLPHFQLPLGYTSQDDYLRHLTYAGAKRRYPELNAVLEERLEFELQTIKQMGFAGYFLIVADFIQAGRDLGVYVGPGRGSAAGSVVAYCTSITNVDPLKYNLLFERFLNPDRKSLPDIDTDFDDEGRAKVIDYVVEKYGRNQVAQIVTFGTMAAKSSIKDVSRVLDLPLSEANALVKLIPDRPGANLNRLMKAPVEGTGSLRENEGFGADELQNVARLRELARGNDLRAQVLHEAVLLEGSVRNTGIHAAGIIIAPVDLSELIPVSTSKETELLVTQYEGNIIESAGVIKMDFLGLKNLTIIRDALCLIKEQLGVVLVLDELPLDDGDTFALFQRGDTNGTFQFESPGMQASLIRLKPDRFEDLIAMNALYRPGPIAYIPDYIDRKHGRQQVSYDLPEMEEYLSETYGITVYQEQVMLLSRKLAGFTKGDADTLRKAMGKKQRDVLGKMKSKFMEGSALLGHPAAACEKIWSDWESFAQYAFNKSHSTCYALVAYQTAYLKTHFPAQYMAAVLTANQHDIGKVTFFMQECRKMGLSVLGPDVNESAFKFSVQGSAQIRFGLGAIKGVGEKAVESVLEEKIRGSYRSIYDFMRRINPRAVNRRTIESLAMSGAFDSLITSRGQLFSPYPGDKTSGLDRLIKYGNDFQQYVNSAQHSLFAGTTHESIAEPDLPADQLAVAQILKNEKEVIGFYLSGHPLDRYQLDLDRFCDTTLQQFNHERAKNFTVAGIVTQVEHKTSKQGRPFGVFTLEDFTDCTSFSLFSEDYLKHKHFLEPGLLLLVKGNCIPRYKDAREAEPRIEGIQLLDEVRSQVRSVQLRLNQAAVDGFLSGDLAALLEKYPGKCAVKLSVFDENGIVVDLYSKSHRIVPSNELYNSLAAKGIDLRLA